MSYDLRDDLNKWAAYCKSLTVDDLLSMVVHCHSATIEGIVGCYTTLRNSSVDVTIFTDTTYHHLSFPSPFPNGMVIGELVEVELRLAIPQELLEEFRKVVDL